MKIFFIRHGQTDYNANRLFYGTSDVSINSTGMKQSQKVKEKLSSYKIKKIYTSTMRRSQETAKIVFPNQEHVQRSFLNEWGFGEWEGLNADQIQAAYPSEWEQWLQDPFGYTPPGAEPFSQFETTMINGFRELLTGNNDCAIVSHLGTIRVLLNFCFPDRSFWEIKLEQNNYTLVSFEAGKFKCDIWNE